MPRQHNLDAHLSDALHHGIKIIHFEPQQNPIPIRPILTIGNRPVMMFHLEAMQLKHKLSVRNQLLISRPSMIAPAPKQTLIPAAARFNIRNGNQRARSHFSSVSTFAPVVLAEFRRNSGTNSGTNSGEFRGEFRDSHHNSRIAVHSPPTSTYSKPQQPRFLI
jgi:hypothetical protein